MPNARRASSSSRYFPRSRHDSAAALGRGPNRGVIRHVSDRIAVMYLGVIVEIAPAESLYESPIHPYTEALLSAIPSIDTDDDAPERRERIVLEGEVPSPIDPPSGCRFHPRCRYATEICRVERPPLASFGNGRFAACHHPLGGARAHDEKGGSNG